MGVGGDYLINDVPTLLGLKQVGGTSVATLGLGEPHSLWGPQALGVLQLGSPKNHHTSQ